MQNKCGQNGSALVIWVVHQNRFSTLIMQSKEFVHFDTTQPMTIAGEIVFQLLYSTKWPTN